MRRAAGPEGTIVVVVGGLLLLAFLAMLASAAAESAAYNRLTGAKTTMWDAVFLELRVQDAPRR